MPHDGLLRFPLWIERSGLPVALAEAAKSPLAWSLFRAIVEADIAEHPRAPEPVELSLETLHERTGIAPDKLRALIPKLRKAGVLRAFVPEGDADAALFQVVAPLPTPTPWADVRASEDALRDLPDAAFRYATEAPPPPVDEAQASEAKLKEVAGLYFDLVSMKMNSFVLDELRLIAARFDMPLIRRVFARARQSEVQSLGWIVREARREREIAEKVEAARRAGRG